MACDEAYYRHFHKKQRHAHAHNHEEQHQHQHGLEDEAEQLLHQHEETLHAHPYRHDDPHHHPEAIQIGVSVYVLENRKEHLLLEDVDLLEFDDDRILVRNVLGKEISLSARLKRIHFVRRGKVLMLIEKA